MNFEAVDVEYYQAQLDSALRLSESAPTVALVDVRHVLKMLLSEASRRLHLDEIEHEMVAATEYDLSAVIDAMEFLRAQPLPSVPINAERSLVPSEELAKLTGALESLRNHQVLRRLEAMLRIQHLVDTPLMNLLICAVAGEVDVDPLVQVGAEKLGHFPEKALVELWARVQYEFSAERGLSTFDPGSDLLPPGFLELISGVALPHKIAEYTLRIKPMLVLASQFKPYPLDSLGPGRLLTVNTTSTQIERDPLRLDLARSISRLSAAWTVLVRGSLEELAGLLGIPENTRLLSGPDAHDARDEFEGALKSAADKSKNAVAATLAVYQAQRLLASIGRIGGATSSIADALRRHKLGLEVTLPESRKSIARTSELTLQKQLCKFLLESGHYAEGTKFGPFEADILATYRAMATVIEVKLYPEKKPPSVRTLRANLSQLHDYMDKRPVRPRGALVVYNLSDTLVVAPNRWIRGRYWVSVVNLGLATGSRRRSTLTLEEAHSGDELLMGYRNTAGGKSATT